MGPRANRSSGQGGCSRLAQKPEGPGGLAVVFSEVTQLLLKLVSHMTGERLQHCRYVIADCIVMNKCKRITMHIVSTF